MIDEYDARAEMVQDSVFRTAHRFEREGEVLRVEMWVKPGGGVFIEHFQPRQEERFEVIEGEITVKIEGREQRLGPGQRAVAKPGQRHTFRNTGSGLAHIVSEVVPALELQEFLTEATALANGGPLTGRGLVMNPAAILDGARLARRYRKTIVMTTFWVPPPRLQPIVFGPLAWLARRVPWALPSRR